MFHGISTLESASYVRERTPFNLRCIIVSCLSGSTRAAKRTRLLLQPVRFKTTKIGLQKNWNALVPVVRAGHLSKSSANKRAAEVVDLKLLVGKIEDSAMVRLYTLSIGKFGVQILVVSGRNIAARREKPASQCEGRKANKGACKNLSFSFLSFGESIPSFQICTAAQSIVCNTFTASTCSTQKTRPLIKATTSASCPSSSNA